MDMGFLWLSHWVRWEPFSQKPLYFSKVERKKYKTLELYCIHVLPYFVILDLRDGNGVGREDFTLPHIFWLDSTWSPAESRWSFGVHPPFFLWWQPSQILVQSPPGVCLESGCPPGGLIWTEWTPPQNTGNCWLIQLESSQINNSITIVVIITY